MLKKLGTLFLVGVLCVSISGCNSTSSKEKSTKLDKNLPDVETATQIPDEELTLDDSLLSRIKDFSSKYTYLKSTQKMTSYSLLNSKKENERTIADVTIEADLVNQIVLTKMVSNYTDSDSTTYSFADDNKNNIHISNLNDGEYIASDDLNASLGIDYSNVVNAYDFIIAMCNQQLPKNTVSTLKDNVYNFTLERKATETDLSGTEYDRLGTTTIVFTVNKDTENNMIPSSITMDTTFFIGQIEYGVSTECTFSDFSTNEITFPEYVKAEE